MEIKLSGINSTRSEQTEKPERRTCATARARSIVLMCFEDTLYYISPSPINIYVYVCIYICKYIYIHVIHNFNVSRWNWSQYETKRKKMNNSERAKLSWLISCNRISHRTETRVNRSCDDRLFSVTAGVRLCSLPPGRMNEATFPCSRQPQKCISAGLCEKTGREERPLLLIADRAVARRWRRGSASLERAGGSASGFENTSAKKINCIFFLADFTVW